MSSRISLAWLLSLSVSTVAGAQDPEPPPSESGGPRLAPAIEAAYGVPPPDAPPDPNTRGEPGFVEQSGHQGPDQTYGPTTRGRDAEGNEITGYQSHGESVFYEPEPGGTAQYHTVQKGDTLWGISGRYLGDPYQWPKLWSYNDHVTNAHWIFPGDVVRLFDPSGGAGTTDGDEGRRRPAEDDAGLRFSRTRIPVTQTPETYVLNQTAFVKAEEFEAAMEVVGAAEAKEMLATLDTVYMEYDKSRPPIPGERLVVYTPQFPVRDVKNKNILGWVVEIVGEINVEGVARETAEGTVSLAFNPIERGYKVGPLQRRFKRVDPKESDRAEVGRVVSTLNATSPIQLGRRKKKKKKPKKHRRGSYDVLAGEEQWVIVDLGADDGIQVGNVLEAVRKGDEYTEKRVFKIPYEEGWPRRIIGSILVVDVQQETALGFVTWSARELERGEHVELRGRGLSDQSPEHRARSPVVEGDASGRAGSGRVEGDARFKIGK